MGSNIRNFGRKWLDAVKTEYQVHIALFRILLGRRWQKLH